MKPQLKIYPKVNDDIVDVGGWEATRKNVDSLDGSLDDLTLRFRDFFKETNLFIFNAVVKEVWLEQQVVVSGQRRRARANNGLNADISFGRFLKLGVGISPHFLTGTSCFMAVATYLIDFFPEFLISDPFKEPDKYLYPYKHVTLDFLTFVHQMDNRLDILDEAEKRSMNFGEFVNWVANWAYCYNEDEKEELYLLKRGNGNSRFHIKNQRLQRFWEKSKFRFDTKK